MTRAVFYSLFVFALVVSYIVAGEITQLIQGVLAWDLGLFVGLPLGLGAVLGGVSFAILREMFKLRSPGPYRPGKIARIVCAVILAYAAALSIYISYSAGAQQLAATAEHKRQAEAERARVAALTPEQRAAEERAAEQKAAAQAKAAAKVKANALALAAKEKHRDAQLQLAGVGALLIKQAMKDPDSFELKSAYVSPNGTACYEYRATNSFGAHLRGEAVMTSKGKILLEEEDYNAFARAWNAGCTKSGGDDLAPLLNSGILNR